MRYRGKLFMIILLLIAFLPASAQETDFTVRVSVNYQDESLEAVIRDLIQRFGIRFSIDPEKVFTSSGKRINLTLTHQPILLVLDSLCAQAGTAYRVTEGHIALFRAKGSLEEVHDDQTIGLTNNTRGTGPMATETHEEPLLLRVQEEVVREQSPEATRAFSPEITESEEKVKEYHVHDISVKQGIPPMYKTMLLEASQGAPPPVTRINPEYDRGDIASPASGKNNSPGSSALTFSLGPVSSIDLNHLSGTSWQNRDFTYKTGINYSLGLGGKVHQNGPWAFRLQVLYATRNFDLYYNLQVVDPDDPYIPEKTVCQAAYLDIPLLANYRWKTKGPWTFSVEGGLVPAFLLDRVEKTYHSNLMEMETPSFLKGEIRKQLISVQAGMEILYRINRSISLLITPQYRLYFDGITREASPTRLGTAHTAIGIMYGF